jgi:large subunit ribosomal protein L32
MACPKKKTSKSKSAQRCAANWKRKANVAAQKAMSQGKSVLTGRAKGFVYPVKETEDEE